MSLMRLLSLAATVGLIIACFFPWVSLPSRNIVVDGLHAEVIKFGKPGYVHFFFSGLFLLFVLLNKVWSLRIAFFVGAINFSWAVRNYMALSACSGGLCPHKHPAIYLLPVLSLLAVVCLLLIRKKRKVQDPDTAAQT